MRTRCASWTPPAGLRLRCPLEPYFLERADRFIVEHIAEPFTVAELARHCGVSWRTLDKAFSAFRGLAPVAHVRNLRLDRAHLALEYRKRFGTAPSQARRAARD